MMILETEWCRAEKFELIEPEPAAQEEDAEDTDEKNKGTSAHLINANRSIQ
jgi:hypothetical protein